MARKSAVGEKARVVAGDSDRKQSISLRGEQGRGGEGRGEEERRGGTNIQHNEYLHTL